MFNQSYGVHITPHHATGSAGARLILKIARFIPSKNRLARNNYVNLASIFLARSYTKSCKSCTKNEAFLARYQKSCKNLARQSCNIIFLQDFDLILQDNYLTIISYKILAKFFVSCKKSFIFSARLARYVQDLVQDLARKIVARFTYFLQDSFTTYSYYLQDFIKSC